jgi:predicted nuclease of restriction endonuclease-like RecB superfamily
VAARATIRFEQALAAEFRAKLRAQRAGWTLAREDSPRAAGELLFLPDFTARHQDGREALIEIVGFWTPEYLAEKVRKLRAARLDNLVLVVYHALDAGGGRAGRWLFRTRHRLV